MSTAQNKKTRRTGRRLRAAATNGQSQLKRAKVMTRPSPGRNPSPQTHTSPHSQPLPLNHSHSQSKKEQQQWQHIRHLWILKLIDSRSTQEDRWMGAVLVDRKPDFVFFASFPLFLGRGECKKTHFSYGKLRPERDAPWSRGQMAKAI